MNTFLETLRNWSEAWGLLIPLAVIIVYKIRGPITRPLVLYIWVAFFINLCATIMFVYHSRMPPALSNNNILYNIHSIARVFFFSWFILGLRLPRFNKLIKIILSVYFVFVVINFAFFESPLFISSLLFSAESIVLLLLCLLFFLFTIQDDSDLNLSTQSPFLVCAAVSLYEAITFFIFLFYNPLYAENRKFGKLTFTIHNMTFVVFCIILAIALYRSRYDRFQALPPYQKPRT